MDRSFPVTKGKVERPKLFSLPTRSLKMVWFLKRCCRWQQLKSKLSHEARNCQVNPHHLTWLLKNLLPWLIITPTSHRITSQ